MKIIFAHSQGFCAGVSYAVAIVENALKKYGPPIYVYHEIVHNTFVVNDFRKQIGRASCRERVLRLV